MKRSLKTLMEASVAAIGFGASTVAQECPTMIGGLAPLSAPGTVVGGEAMRDAMLIAEEDINAAGGVLGCEVEVVIGDTRETVEKRLAGGRAEPAE